MKAADVMSPRVISVKPTDTVADAVRLMIQDGISGLPVIDSDHTLVGIITEGDLIRRTEIGTSKHHPRWIEFVLGPATLAAEYVQSHSRTVADIMSRNVVTITDETPLEHIAYHMEKRRIKRLPVIRNERVVGMVSRSDLLRAIASNANVRAPVAADDVKIREAILKVLENQHWATQGISVLVTNGVVDLWGAVFSENERAAMHVVARNVDGVRDVRDHLVLIDPFTSMVLDPARV